MKNGRNHNYICQDIQKDSVEEFVAYISKTNLSLSMTKIEQLFFETNSFLNDQEKGITLNEYAFPFSIIKSIIFWKCIFNRCIFP